MVTSNDCRPLYPSAVTGINSWFKSGHYYQWVSYNVHSWLHVSCSQLRYWVSEKHMVLCESSNVLFTCMLVVIRLLFHFTRWIYRFGFQWITFLVINQVYSSVHLKFHLAVAISTEHWVPTPSVFCHFPESFLNLIQYIYLIYLLPGYAIWQYDWHKNVGRGCLW